MAETFPFGAKTSVFKVVGKIVRPGKRGNPAGEGDDPAERGNPAVEGDDPAEDGDAILSWSVARLLLAVPVLLAVPELLASSFSTAVRGGGPSRSPRQFEVDVDVVPLGTPRGR